MPTCTYNQYIKCTFRPKTLTLITNCPWCLTLLLEVLPSNQIILRFSYVTQNLKTLHLGALQSGQPARLQLYKGSPDNN